VGDEERPGVGRKSFFFEKKKQKTFSLWVGAQAGSMRAATSKSFLVLFFKKERLPSFPGTVQGG